MNNKQEEIIWIKYNKKELKNIENVPTECGCIQKNDSYCKVKPTFRNKNNPNIWRCGKHTNTKKKTKNTMHDREGSWRYSIAMSLQEANSCTESSIEDRNTCFYCKIELNKTTKKAIDHIYPVINNKLPTKHIINNKYNKIICCAACNSSKGNKDPLLWINSKNFEEDVKETLIEKSKKIPSFDTKTFQNVILYKYNIAVAILTRISAWVSEPGNSAESLENMITDIVNITKKY